MMSENMLIIIALSLIVGMICGGVLGAVFAWQHGMRTGELRGWNDAYFANGLSARTPWKFQEDYES